MTRQTTIRDATRHTLAVHEPVRLDLAYHGARFIIIEFAVATLICAGVTGLEIVASLTRAHATANLVGGAIFLSCGLNALTFLLLAIAINRHEGGSLRQDYTGGQIALYTLEVVILLLAPLVFPVFGLIQRTGADVTRGRDA